MDVADLNTTNHHEEGTIAVNNGFNEGSEDKSEAPRPWFEDEGRAFTIDDQTLYQPSTRVNQLNPDVH